MNKKFVKTKNVKEFVGFMEELKFLPPNIPKIALVYGDYGLGKSETIKWWTFKNDCVYVRATKGMSVRWLLSEISEELGEEPYWRSQETFNMIENKIRKENNIKHINIIQQINLRNSLLIQINSNMKILKGFPEMYYDECEDFPNCKYDEKSLEELYNIIK